MTKISRVGLITQSRQSNHFGAHIRTELKTAEAVTLGLISEDHLQPNFANNLRQKYRVFCAVLQTAPSRHPIPFITHMPKYRPQGHSLLDYTPRAPCLPQHQAHG